MARQIRIKKKRTVVLLVSALVTGCLALSPVANASESAPDAGWVFEPASIPPPLYGVQHPSVDPEMQRHVVEAADGTDIFLETWLPVAKDGNVPPEKIPTVLTMSPYAFRGHLPFQQVSKFMQILVERGYAYSVMHIRGTGASGGCADWLGPHDADDGAQTIAYLGKDAPWSNGIVGTLGKSYSGGSQLAAAATGRYGIQDHLKAIVTSATWLPYEFGFYDGVPPLVSTGYSWPPLYYHGYSVFPGANAEDLSNGEVDEFSESRSDPNSIPDPAYAPEKMACYGDNLLGYLNPDGGVSDYFQARDHRAGVENITAATLVTHGHVDAVPETNVAGFFDRLPASTPKAGIFGFFGHDLPDEHASGVRREWERADFESMVVGWFDHYLRGVDNGADRWPIAQVQGNDGQWRTEPEWPTTGGPAGHLALGLEGVLGATEPSGSSTYQENIPLDRESKVQVPGNRVVFTTEALPERLQITGQPVLDLWVILDKSDAHIAATLEMFDANDQLFEGGRLTGFRSARHIEPLVGNRFAQGQGIPAPVGEPIRVQVRFTPTDLVVPKGGYVKLSVSGSERWAPGLETIFGLPERVLEDPNRPSGSATTVTILHDCSQFVSALRFLTARSDPDYINVREKDEGDSELETNPGVAPVSDAGGLVSRPVCGLDPERLHPTLGSEIDYRPHAGGVTKEPR